MENPIKMDDLWYPHFQEPPHNDQILSAMWMIKNTYYIPVSLIPRFSKIITPIRSLFTLICEQNDEPLLWTDFLPYIPIIMIIYEAYYCYYGSLSLSMNLPYIPFVFRTLATQLMFSDQCFRRESGVPPVPPSPSAKRIPREPLVVGVQQSHHAPSASTTPPIHWNDTVYGYSMGWLMLCLQEWFVIGDTWIYIYIYYI